MKRIGIILLISTLSLIAVPVNKTTVNKTNNKITNNNVKNNNKDSFDALLKILKEKEALQQENKLLKERINTLEKSNSANNNKYQVLLESFKTIKKTETINKKSSTNLIKEEIKSRLPLPFNIYNINNINYANVLKLNWYYTFDKDGNSMYNGYYKKKRIKINDKFFNYFVKEINDKNIIYCRINNKIDCIKKSIIKTNLISNLLKLIIKNGIPNKMLIINNDNESQKILLSKLLKNNNALVQKEINIKKSEDNNNNSLEDNNNLEDNKLINPVDKNGNKTGVTIPKNNVPVIKVK